MLSRLARWCVRRRRLVVFGIWLPLLVGLLVISGALGSAFETDFNFPDSESAQVQTLLEDVSLERAGFTGQIVLDTDAGVDDPAVQAAVEPFLAEVDEIEGVEVISPYSNPGQISEDGTIGFAQLNVTERGQAEFLELSDDVQALGDQVGVDGLTIEYGGDVFAEFELPASEILGVLAAVIILIIAFGSVLAMGLPIGTALFGLVSGAALVIILSHVASMPEFTPQMVAMIGLGVGIDYALFIVTRYREGLRDNLSVEDAIVEALDTSGRAVVFAGATVIISLLGLFIMQLAFMNGLAIGAVVGVLAMVLASLTLLPALLAMAGHKIDVTSRAALAAVVIIVASAIAWVITETPAVLGAGVVVALALYLSSVRVFKSLRIPLPHRHEKPLEQRFWYRWSRLVQRRPWPILVGGVGFLVLLTIPLFSIRLGFGDTGNLPERQTARRAYDMLAEGFGPGIGGPLIITVEGDTANDPAALEAFAAEIGATEGVQFSAPPTQLGDGLAMITAYPASSPQDEATTDLVHRLRDDVIPASGVDAKLGGFTAGGVDFANYIGDRLPLLIGAVLVLSFLLLMAVFRSLLVPLKAVVLNLLSVGAAYGSLVAIFQWGWGKGLIGVGREGPIEAWAPMMLFAIVFGLSMDYEVFLLSRIKERYDHTKDNATAVADGLAVTARVITAAALIMVCVFLSFVLGDTRDLKLFGLGLAIAVFVDATVVRMLLVPATMELLGDRNWWIPKWLDRILPKIDVEGHHHEAGVPVTASSTPFGDGRVAGNGDDVRDDESELV